MASADLKPDRFSLMHLPGSKGGNWWLRKALPMGEIFLDKKPEVVTINFTS
jgi:hypothetical protein